MYIVHICIYIFIYVYAYCITYVVCTLYNVQLYTYIVVVHNFQESSVNLQSCTSLCMLTTKDLMKYLLSNACIYFNEKCEDCRHST